LHPDAGRQPDANYLRPFWKFIEDRHRPVATDCGGFTGRKLAICNGTSGLPEETRQAYLALWASQPIPKRGFGDTVADFIKRATWGWLKPTPGCGCEKRRDWLNRLFPYGSVKGN
jgi:hypothetical protein